MTPEIDTDVRELLERCEDYFDRRADAESPPEGLNSEETLLLTRITRVLNRLDRKKSSTEPAGDDWRNAGWEIHDYDD